MRKVKDQAAGPPEPRDPRIAAALNLWLSPNPTVSVREMAAATNLSPAQFSQLFVRTTGMLPGDFRRMLKRYHKEQALALKILGKVNG